MSEQEDDGGGNKAVELVFIKREMHPGLGIHGAIFVSNQGMARDSRTLARDSHAHDHVHVRMRVRVRVPCAGA